MGEYLDKKLCILCLRCKMDHRAERKCKLSMGALSDIDVLRAFVLLGRQVYSSPVYFRVHYWPSHSQVLSTRQPFCSRRSVYAPLFEGGGTRHATVPRAGLWSVTGSFVTGDSTLSMSVRSRLNSEPGSPYPHKTTEICRRSLICNPGIR